MKTTHKAKAVREDGAMSALCFKRPLPIRLKVATWTNRDEAVTCPRCLRALRLAKALGGLSP